MRESVLPLQASIVVNEVPLLPPERVAIDLARMSRRMDALPLLDKALHSGSCTMAGLAAEVVAHKGLRGVIQARELVPMADSRPESVQESRLRLIIIDAGLPCPTPQLMVDFFRLDLGYEAFKVGSTWGGGP